MASVPFQREIEDLFASDKSILLKLLGGGVVGAVVSFRAFKKATTLSMDAKVMIAIGAAVVGMLIVLLLTLRDVVNRRVEQGQPVNPLLRAYFGKGNKFLMVVLWFFTLMMGMVIMSVLTINL